MAKGKGAVKSAAKDTAPQVRQCMMHPHFLDDLAYWIGEDAKIAQRLLRIVRETQRDPFKGIGKPEPLKYLEPNTWSRRLTDTDRVVYRVTDAVIYFAQARYHY